MRYLAVDATAIVGKWSVVSDTTAAGGKRMQNANSGAAKLTTPRATPPDYVEVTFEADAGRPYRLWFRGKALSNSWANDSVFVQFSGTVDAKGAAAYRIGTATGLTINLEDDVNLGVAGWGWQDTGYGKGVLGPTVVFAQSGLQTLRIQTREDGLGIDQVVLSAVKYMTASPGTLKNDTVILPR